MNARYSVTFGGWYQRTTLHLTEVYNLLSAGKVDTHLDQDKGRELHRNLHIKSITRESGYLEYVRAITEESIEIRYYEDGLYILELHSADIFAAKKALEGYFNEVFNPAVGFIFSRGAPTPKELANITTAHPTVVRVSHDGPENFRVAPTFGSVYNTIQSNGVLVHKTPSFIFVVQDSSLGNNLTEIVEMQIFFREFKDQLEKYLTIHRNLWEEISAIKEQKTIRGKDIEQVRGRLDGYQKTISLITNRINQMGSYVRTRAALSKKLEVEEHLRTLFEFKFESLTDSLDYIKEIWKMTSDYLNSAIQVVVEIKNQGTSRGIQSLQVITSIGVISTIIGFLAKNEWPAFTGVGAAYLVLIIFITWLINYVVSLVFKYRVYKIKLRDRVTDL